MPPIPRLLGARRLTLLYILVLFIGLSWALVHASTSPSSYKGAQDDGSVWGTPVQSRVVSDNSGPELLAQRSTLATRTLDDDVGKDAGVQVKREGDEAKEKVVHAQEKAAKTTAKAQAEAKKSIQQGQREAQAAVKQAQREGQETAEETVNSVKQARAEAKEDIADAKMEAQEAMQDAQERVVEAKQEAAQAVREAQGQGQEAMAQAQEEGAKAVESAQMAVDDARDQAENAVKEGEQEARDAVAEAKAQVQEGKEDASQAVEEGKAQAQEAVEDAKEQGQQAVEDAKQQAEDAKQQAQHAVEDARQAVEDGKQQAQQAVDDAQQAYQQGKEDAVQAVQDAREQAEKAVEDVKQQAQDMVQNIKDNGKQMVKDEARKALANICSKPIKVNADVTVEFHNKKQCVDYPKKSGGVTIVAFTKTFKGQIKISGGDRQFEGQLSLSELKEPFGIKGLTIYKTSLHIKIDLDRQGVHRLRLLKLCGGVKFGEGTPSSTNVDLCVDLDLESQSYEVKLRQGPLRVKNIVLMESFRLMVKKAASGQAQGWEIEGSAKGVSLRALLTLAGVKKIPEQLPQDIRFENVEVALNTVNGAFAVSGTVKMATSTNFVGLRITEVVAAISRQDPAAPLSAKVELKTADTQIIGQELLLGESAIFVNWAQRKLDVEASIQASVLGNQMVLKGKLVQSTGLVLEGGTAEGASWKDVFGMRGATVRSLKIRAEMDSKAKPKVRTFDICGELVIGADVPQSPGLALCAHLDPAQKIFKLKSQKSPLTLNKLTLLDSLQVEVSKLPDPVGWSIQGQATGINPDGFAKVFLQALKIQQPLPAVIPQGIKIDTLKIAGVTTTNTWSAAGKIDFTGNKGLGSLKLKTLEFRAGRKNVAFKPYCDIKLVVASYKPFPDFQIASPSSIEAKIQGKRLDVKGEMRVKVFETNFDFTAELQQDVLTLTGGLAPGNERWEKPLMIPGFFMSELKAEATLALKKKPLLQDLKVCGAGGFLSSPEKDMPLCIQADTKKKTYQMYANGVDRHLVVGGAHLAKALDLKAQKQGQVWKVQGKVLELQLLVMLHSIAGPDAENLPVPLKPGTIIRVLKAKGYTGTGKFNVHGSVLLNALKGQDLAGIKLKGVDVTVSRQSKTQPLDMSMSVHVLKTKLFEQVYINPSTFTFEFIKRKWKGKIKTSATIFGKTVMLEGEATRTMIDFRARMPPNEKWGDFFGFKGIEISGVDIDMKLDKNAFPKLVRLNFCGKVAFGNNRSVFISLCVMAIPRKGIFRVYPRVKPLRIGLPKLPPLAFDIDLTFKRIRLPDLKLPNMPKMDLKVPKFSFSGKFIDLNLSAFMIAVFRICAPSLNIKLPDWFPMDLKLPNINLGSLPQFPGIGFKGFGSLDLPSLKMPNLFGFKLPKVDIRFGKLGLKGFAFGISFETLSWSIPGLPEIGFDVGKFNFDWKLGKLNLDVQIPLIFFKYRLNLRGIIKGINIRLSAKLPKFEMPELFDIPELVRLEDVTVEAHITKKSPFLKKLTVCGRGILLENALTNENQLHLCISVMPKKKAFRIYNIGGPIEIEKLHIADKVDITVTKHLKGGYKFDGLVKGVKIQKLMTALMKKTGGGDLPPLLPKGFALNSLKVKADSRTKAFYIDADVTTNFDLSGIKLTRIGFMLEHNPKKPKPTFGVRVQMEGSLYDGNIVIRPSVLTLKRSGKKWEATGDIQTRLFKEREFAFNAYFKSSGGKSQLRLMANLDIPWSVFDIDSVGALELETVGFGMLTTKGKPPTWQLWCKGGFYLDMEPLRANVEGSIEFSKGSQSIALKLRPSAPIEVGFDVPLPSLKPTPEVDLRITYALVDLRSKRVELAGTVSAKHFPGIGKKLENVDVAVSIQDSVVKIVLKSLVIAGQIKVPPGSSKPFGVMNYELGPMSLEINKGKIAAVSQFAVGIPKGVNKLFAGTEVFLTYRKGDPKSMVRGEVGYTSVTGLFARLKTPFLNAMKPVKPPPAHILMAMAKDAAKQHAKSAQERATDAVVDKATQVAQEAEQQMEKDIAPDVLLQTGMSTALQLAVANKDAWVGIPVPHIGDIHMTLPTFVYSPEKQLYMARGSVYFPKGISIPFGFFKKILKKRKGLKWAASLIPNDYKLNEFKLFDESGNPVDPNSAVSKLSALSEKTFDSPLPQFVSKVVETVWKALNLKNMPPAWKPHMRITVPKYCKYYFKYTPPAGVGNLEFEFDFGGQSLSFVTIGGPFLLGTEIRRLSAGAVMGGQAMIARIDADIQVIDFMTLGMALTLPKGFMPTENSHFDIYLHNVTTLIHPATAGIPVPIFWDKLGWKFDILGGLRSEVTLKFPQPNVAPGPMIKLIKECFKFAKDPSYFFDVPDRPGLDANQGSDIDGIDLVLTVGKVYFMLPEWMAGVTIGDAEKGGDRVSAKALLNAVKKRRLDLVVEQLPFRLRSASAEISFLGIKLAAAVAITTGREMQELGKASCSPTYYGKFRDYITGLKAERQESFRNLVKMKSKSKVKTDTEPVMFVSAGEWQFSKLAGFSVEFGWGGVLSDKQIDVQAGFGMRGNMFVIIEVAMSGQVSLKADPTNPKQTPGITAKGDVSINVFGRPVLTGSCNATTENGGGLGVSLQAALFPPGFPIECKGDVTGYFSRDKIQVEGGVSLGISFLPALTFGKVHLFMNPDVGLTVTAVVLNAKAVMHLTKTGVMIEMSSIGIKPLLYIGGKSSMGGPILVIDTGEIPPAKSKAQSRAERSALQDQQIAEQEAELAQFPEEAPLGTQDLLFARLGRGPRYPFLNETSLLLQDMASTAGPKAYLQGTITVLGITGEVEASLSKEGAEFRTSGDLLGLIQAEAMIKTGPKLLADPSGVELVVTIIPSAFLNEVLKLLGAMLKVHEAVVGGLKRTFGTAKVLIDQIKRGLKATYVPVRAVAKTFYLVIKNVHKALKKLGVNMGSLPPFNLPEDPWADEEQISYDLLISRVQSQWRDIDLLVQEWEANGDLDGVDEADAQIGDLDHTMRTMDLAEAQTALAVQGKSKFIKKMFNKAKKAVKKAVKKVSSHVVKPMKKKFKKALDAFKKSLKKAQKLLEKIKNNPQIKEITDRLKALAKKIQKAVKWIADNIPRPSSVAVRKVEISTTLQALEGSASVGLDIEIGVGSKRENFVLQLDINAKDMLSIFKQCFKKVLKMFTS
eukprot:TRINITY_DN527_c0_g1_i1.p1 TRINITY_DN527_c0_g1~~TRINITY_DN527_c0_g1_i1.p1  ORF type:complete len:3163 (+),score=988.85 TRINITY_DN527_c0_g1_i1:116-9604(+)